MTALIIAGIIAFIPAYIAHKKGRNKYLWYFFGFMLWIVAFPCSLLIKKTPEMIEKEQLESGMKRCPSCAEMVQGKAIVCRYCGGEVK